MIKRSLRLLGLVVAFGLQSQPAFAFDWSVSTARVTFIEPSYAPLNIPFQINVAAGSCAAGATLTWAAQGSDEAIQIANGTAILSTLLTALVSGRNIQIYGNNAGCAVQYIHIQ